MPLLSLMNNKRHNCNLKTKVLQWNGWLSSLSDWTDIVVLFASEKTKTQYLFIASYYRQLSADIKMKNHKIKTSQVSPKGTKAQANKTGINILFLNSLKIVCNTMLYISFQYGWEPVQFQRILIGIKAILEKFFFQFYNQPKINKNDAFTWP